MRGASDYFAAGAALSDFRRLPDCSLTMNEWCAALDADAARTISTGARSARRTIEQIVAGLSEVDKQL